MSGRAHRPPRSSCEAPATVSGPVLTVSFRGRPGRSTSEDGSGLFTHKRVLQEHFAGMPWYKPDPAYTDKRLTKNDQRNVALISAVEREFGGALVDKDFQAANPSSAEDVAPPIPYEGTA